MAKNTTVPAKSGANTANVPALDLSDDFEGFAGAGTENFTAKDILIPRLTILQALSPQLNNRKPEFISGAKQGDICDVGLGEIFESLAFLPVHFRKDWLEWAPRASGKGLVAIHSTDDILAECQPDEKGRPIRSNGNYIAETAQWFGLNLAAGGRPCFIPMASTMLKRSRKWGALANAEKLPKKDGSGEYTAPLFYRVYQLTTTPESNAEGDWFTWSIERGPAMPQMEHGKALLRAAMDFRKAIIAGEARADVASMQDDSSSHSNEGAM